MNLALLKAELIHARHERDGLPLRVRMLSNVDLLGQIGLPDSVIRECGLDRFCPLRADGEDAGTFRKASLPQYARRTVRSMVCESM